jgi:alkanesulfonate monooxygenase SsuD/methylene tetrahydromethanopterin reductase-like flavin-dependent oxidoreductase (luciferase family)
VRFGLDVATSGEWADPTRLADLAFDAEAAGWDGFFLWDILATETDGEDVVDPWVTLAVIAARTRRIRIGALVTPLARRRPWDVARQVATLDALSGGRMVFGAGLGWKPDEFDRLGEDPAPATRAQRLDEGLMLLDRFWSGESVSFTGRHFRVRDVRIVPRPIQRPRVPIWLAAGWPRTAPLRRAARYDGVYLMDSHQVTHERLTPGDVRSVIETINAHRESAIQFDVAVNIATEDDRTAMTQNAALLAEAGATWAIELTPETFQDHVELVRRGPARRQPTF